MKNLKIYIIKSHTTPKTLNLEIIATSRLYQIREACKIVRLLNISKEDGADKYHIIYNISNSKALDEIEERIKNNV